MRSLFGSLASLLVVLAIGCNAVDPSECWPNTSGGLGGGEPIPIGAGVGASSGDYASEPPRGPLESGGTPNPCMATPSSPEGTYIRCRGLGPMACAAECNAIGAYCVEHAEHPQNPSVGIGDLKQCMENLASYTCTYCYPNKDVCTFICAFKGCGFGNCTNTGGKGCE